ncbi:MAG: hypothetical protein ACETVY_01080 [Candidatus Bathyarchaeia archaeon]
MPYGTSSRGLRPRGGRSSSPITIWRKRNKFCDRVDIIDRGRLIALGTPGELMEKHSARNPEDIFIQLTRRRIRRGSIWTLNASLPPPRRA